MLDQNPFTEEGRTRFRNFGRRLAGYLIVSAMLGALTGFGVFRLWTRANLAPLQKLYLRQYGLGSLKAIASEKAASRYTLLTCRMPDATTGGVNDAQCIRSETPADARSEMKMDLSSSGIHRGRASCLGGK